jgi:hypothetical protein
MATAVAKKCSIMLQWKFFLPHSFLYSHQIKPFFRNFLDTNCCTFFLFVTLLWCFKIGIPNAVLETSSPPTPINYLTLIDFFNVEWVWSVITFTTLPPEKLKQIVPVAFWVVTSCSVVRCYRRLRGTCCFRVATHQSQRMVSTQEHPQPLTSPLRELAQSHNAFLLPACFISISNMSSAAFSGESYQFHKFFLWLMRLILKVAPSPPSLYTLFILCLHPSLPLTAHLVNCKM